MAVKKSSKPGQAAIPAIAAIPADVPRVATPATVPSRKSAIKPERLVQGIPCEGSPYADDAPRLTTYGVVKMADLLSAFIAELEQIATVEDAAAQSLLALTAVTKLSWLASGDTGVKPFIYAIKAVEKSLPSSKRGPRFKEGAKAVAAIQILVAAEIGLERAIADAVDLSGTSAASRNNTIRRFREHWNDRAIYSFRPERRSRTEAQARAAVKRLYRISREVRL